MTRVFIGGSRRISRLGAEIRLRLDRIVEKRLPVLIGDANGADRAVQAYLGQQSHDLVEVFCADETPRNNIGHWPVRTVRPAGKRRDFDYYAAKDRVMADESTVGLMLWDGESRGTVMNVLRLAEQRKPVVVYVAPRREFVDVRTPAEFEALVGDQLSVRRLRERLAHEARPQGPAQLPL